MLEPQVNNIDLIKPFLQFDEKEPRDTFYFMQIVRRKKDDENAPSQMIVKEYSPSTMEGFEKAVEEAIQICNLFGARLYMYLNKRSFKKCSLKAMKKLVDSIESEQFWNARTCFTSSAGSYHADDERKWIVDVDNKQIPKEQIVNIINSCEPEGSANKIILSYPTVNGYHFITRPFNKEEFNMKLSRNKITSVDIFPNAMSLLYFNQSL